MKAIITKDAGNGYFPECGMNYRTVTPSYKRESSIVKYALRFTMGRCNCRIEYFRGDSILGEPYKVAYIW